MDHRGTADRIRPSCYAAHGIEANSNIHRTKLCSSPSHQFYLRAESRGNAGNAPSAIIIKTEKEIGQIVFW